MKVDLRDWVNELYKFPLIQQEVLKLLANCGIILLGEYKLWIELSIGYCWCFTSFQIKIILIINQNNT